VPVNPLEGLNWVYLDFFSNFTEFGILSSLPTNVFWICPWCCELSAFARRCLIRQELWSLLIGVLHNRSCACARVCSVYVTSSTVRFLYELVCRRTSNPCVYAAASFVAYFRAVLPSYFAGWCWLGQFCQSQSASEWWCVANYGADSTVSTGTFNSSFTTSVTRTLFILLFENGQKNLNIFFLNRRLLRNYWNLISWVVGNRDLMKCECNTIC